MRSLLAKEYNSAIVEPDEDAERIIRLLALRIKERREEKAVF